MLRLVSYVLLLLLLLHDVRSMKLPLKNVSEIQIRFDAVLCNKKCNTKNQQE
jgi:hypothetical protein